MTDFLSIALFPEGVDGNDVGVFGSRFGFLRRGVAVYFAAEADTEAHARIAEIGNGGKGNFQPVGNPAEFEQGRKTGFAARWSFLSGTDCAAGRPF